MTLAIILGLKDACFDRLGVSTAFSRCYDSVRAVRGVDRIFCCLSAANAENATGTERVVLKGKQLEAIDENIYNPLTHVADSSDKLFLIADAVTPFVPAARMEYCLERARRYHTDVAYTALVFRRAFSEIRGGKLNLAPASALARGCYAFHRDCLHSPTRLFPVNLSWIEALDVSDPAQNTISVTLVEANKV